MTYKYLYQDKNNCNCEGEIVAKNRNDAYVLLRKQGIRCEIYPDSAKMKKQMQYANQKAVPFVAMTGETEMAEGKVMLKNMQTGEQKLLLPEEIADAIN